MLLCAGFRCENLDDQARGRLKNLRRNSRQSTLSEYGIHGETRHNLKDRFNDALRKMLLLTLVLSLALFFLGILATITWGLRGDL